MLFDTHCHLDFDDFGESLDEVLATATREGVERIVSIGAGRGVESMHAAVAIAHAHRDWIHASAGIHPHDAKLWSAGIASKVETLASDTQVVAIGETGLDFHYNHSERDKQEEAFRAQIAIAKRARKPLIIHTRTAAEDTLRILREEQARDVGGIIHCFSENAPFAKAALDLNFVSSFSGIVTFKNAKDIQQAARVQPKDAILVETDAPYLAPVPYRGKRNEPAYVKHTAAFIAALRNEDFEAFCEQTTNNALRVFKLS